MGYTLSIPVIKELRSHGNPHFMEGQLELRFGFSWSYNSDFPNHMVAIGLPSPDKGNVFFVVKNYLYYKIYKQIPGICHLINKPGCWVAGKSCFEFDSFLIWDVESCRGSSSLIATFQYTSLCHRANHVIAAATSSSHLKCCAIHIDFQIFPVESSTNNSMFYA